MTAAPNTNLLSQIPLDQLMTLAQAKGILSNLSPSQKRSACHQLARMLNIDANVLIDSMTAFEAVLLRVQETYETILLAGEEDAYVAVGTIATVSAVLIDDARRRRVRRSMSNLNIWLWEDPFKQTTFFSRFIFVEVILTMFF